MGSTWETAVNTEPGLTKLPICTCAIPATPSISEVTLVNSRLRLRLFHFRLCGSNGCPRSEFSLYLVIELTLRDRSGFRERRVAFNVEFGFAELRLSLRLLRFRLIEGGFERARSISKRSCPLRTDRSFFVILANEVPGDARLDFGVHEAIKCCHPLA